MISSLLFKSDDDIYDITDEIGNCLIFELNTGAITYARARTGFSSTDMMLFLIESIARASYSQLVPCCESVKVYSRALE
jgi:hypothetical protein